MVLKDFLFFKFLELKEFLPFILLFVNFIFSPETLISVLEFLLKNKLFITTNFSFNILVLDWLSLSFFLFLSFFNNLFSLCFFGGAPLSSVSFWLFLWIIILFFAFIFFDFSLFAIFLGFCSFIFLFFLLLLFIWFEK